MSDSQPKILVATDGSKASFHAAERAVYLAGHMGAKLYVLYAIDKDRVFHAGIHYGEDLRELHKAGKEATEKVAALADKARRGVREARGRGGAGGKDDRLGGPRD
jgi:nucleotide-binding universal stress UspA family protein